MHLGDRGHLGDVRLDREVVSQADEEDADEGAVQGRRRVHVEELVVIAITRRNARKEQQLLKKAT